jgi:hypothetical protein
MIGKLGEVGTLDDVGLLSDLLALAPSDEQHPLERAAMAHSMQRLAGVVSEPFDLSGVVSLPTPQGEGIAWPRAAAPVARSAGGTPCVGMCRVLRLCVLALILGPVAAAGLAAFAILFGVTDPDRWQVTSFVGIVAGVMGALLLGIICMIWEMGRGRVRRHEHGGTVESPHRGTGHGNLER